MNWYQLGFIVVAVYLAAVVLLAWIVTAFSDRSFWATLREMLRALLVMVLSFVGAGLLIYSMVLVWRWLGVLGGGV